MKYRPDIDGLRALAVLPVMFFHAGLAPFSGGFVGVDVFFVISGYLISRIILDDLNSGRFSVVTFYERRARRILPALFLIMGCCLPVAWLLMDPFELKEFAQSLVGTSVFLSNMFFYLKSGYFDAASTEKPLLHTWSLAVEEQFYLTFPLLLMLLWRYGREYIPTALGIFAAASLMLAASTVQADPNAAFYLPFTRAWELLIGALCALTTRRITPVTATAAGCVGICLIAGAIGGFDESTPTPSLYTLLPVTGTALLVVAGSPATWPGRLLASRPLVAIGLASYSAYLWHQPILAFLRLQQGEPPGTALALAACGLALALALVTHRYVELPFRTRTGDGAWTRRGIFSAAAAVTATLVGLGLTGHLRDGFPERSPVYAQLAQNFGFGVLCNGNRLDTPACRAGSPVRSVVWGDSYAMHITKAIRLAEADGVAQVTLSACPPIVGFGDAPRKSLATACEDFNARVLADLLAGRDPVARVYLSSAFDALAGPGGAASSGLLAVTIRRLQAAGKEVVLVGPSPTPGYDVGKCVRRSARQGTPAAGCDFPATGLSMAYRATMAALRAVAIQTRSRLVDLEPVVCPSGTCKAVMRGRLVYRGDGHFANASDVLLAQAFRDLGRPP